MQGERIEATVRAIVLLVEVCQRVDIPLTVFTFSIECDLLIASHDTLNYETQSRIGNLITSPCGGTRLEPALEKVQDHFSTLTFSENYLVLLTDGQHSEGENPGHVIQQLQRSGVRVLGMGLGPNSDQLLEFLPTSRVNLEPHQVAEVFIQILMSSAHGAGETVQLV
jgi:hypothetical protein